MLLKLNATSKAIVCQRFYKWFLKIPQWQVIPLQGNILRKGTISRNVDSFAQDIQWGAIIDNLELLLYITNQSQTKVRDKP